MGAYRSTGEFQRDQRYITSRITADGRDGYPVEPGRYRLVVVLTDGRATGGPDPLGRSRSAARRLVAEGASAVVVDCETSYIRLGLATDLAEHLQAPVLQLEQLRADYLAQAVRRAA